MRTLTLLLSGTTAALALACGYLAVQVRDERQRADEFAAQLAEARTSVQRSLKAVANAPERDGPAAVALAPAPSADPVPAKPSVSFKVASDEETRRARGVWSRVRNDPRNQLILVEQFKSDVRRRHPGLGKALGMTREEEQAFLDFLARQQLAASDREAQTGEVADTVAPKDLESRLGAEKLARYKAYQESLPDRLQAVALQSRLQASQALSEEQSDYLITAMREERQQYMQELQQQPWFAGLVDQASAYPVVVMLTTSDPVETFRAAEEKLSRSQAFTERVHQRASGILTTEQLHALDQLLGEHLVQERMRLAWLRAEADKQP